VALEQIFAEGAPDKTACGMPPTGPGSVDSHQAGTRAAI